MRQLFNKLQEWYYTKIKRWSKHTFISIADGKIGAFTYSRYKCTKCGATLSLDKWQMDNLPVTMKYKSKKSKE